MSTVPFVSCLNPFAKKEWCALRPTFDSVAILTLRTTDLSNKDTSKYVWFCELLFLFCEL